MQMKKGGQKLANRRVNVVSLPLERLRHSFPRFLSGGGLGGEKCEPYWLGSLFLLARLLVPDGPAVAFGVIRGLFFYIRYLGRPLSVSRMTANVRHSVTGTASHMP